MNCQYLLRLHPARVVRAARRCGLRIAKCLPLPLLAQQQHLTPGTTRGKKYLSGAAVSYGQGEAFTHANRRDIGYGDLRDILKDVDTVETQYPIDVHREGVLGWSYGACMAMFATTQTYRFRASVAGAGISDYISFFGETSYTTFTIPLFGATPYDDPEIYTRSSALTYVKQSSTPTLLLAGERDGGATPDQSMEFWRGLLTQNVPTELVIYAGEGHHFNKADLNDTLARAAMWLEQYMGEQAIVKK